MENKKEIEANRARYVNEQGAKPREIWYVYYRFCIASAHGWGHWREGL